MAPGRRVVGIIVRQHQATQNAIQKIANNPYRISASGQFHQNVRRHRRDRPGGLRQAANLPNGQPVNHYSSGMSRGGVS